MRPAVPLLMCALGLALLHAAGSLLAPVPMALAEAGRHEGARVVVEGWVTSVRAGARGAAVELADGEARLIALASAGEAPLRGTAVRVVGVVARDRDGFVLSAERFEARGPPPVESVAAALSRLADGRPARVEGIAVGGFLREGDRGIPLRGAAPEGPLQVGGVLRLDPARAQYFLEVAEWTRP